MPYDAVTAQGMTYARFRTWRRGQNDNGFYSIEMTNSVGGNMTLTPEFVELFCLPGDDRNTVIAGNTGKILMRSLSMYTNMIMQQVCQLTYETLIKEI